MAGIDASAMWDLVSALKEMLGVEASDGTEQALVTRVERDGTVYVRLLGADVETPVNGERLSDVEAGDVVTVSVANGLLSIVGNSTRPSTNAEHVSKVVEPVAQRADNAAERASEANDRAVDAGKVANATAQHVWTDDSGLHVTEVTQEEWSDEQGASYHSGMNVLINSLGQLFRSGLNNLLGIVSGATPSISIYDGAGNNDSNIVARFAANLIELGKGSATAVVEFCGGLGRIGYNYGYYNTFLIDGNGHQVVVTGGSQPAYIASDGGYIGADSTGPFIAFDTIQLNNIDESIYETFTTAEVVGAIPVTLYDNDSASPSASATLSETAANFSRLTIFYKDSDNNRSSVDVWSPNGKRVSLSLTWINGTANQQMWQRVRYVTISGTTIETSKLSGDVNFRTGQIQLGTTGSVTNSDYISITHVIGYR